MTLPEHPDKVRSTKSIQQSPYEKARMTNCARQGKYDKAWMTKYLRYIYVGKLSKEPALVKCSK
jgi:hypothetical protein